MRAGRGDEVGIGDGAAGRSSRRRSSSSRPDSTARPAAARTAASSAGAVAAVLADVVGGAELHGGDGEVLRSRVGHDDDRELRPRGAQRPQDVEPAADRAARAR